MGHDILGYASIMAAGLGAYLCFIGRRRDLVVEFAMMLMLVAMIDTMGLKTGLLSPGQWGVALGAAAACVAALRWRQPLGFDRAAHLAVMALMTATMGFGMRHTDSMAVPMDPESAGAVHDMPGMPGMSAAQHQQTMASMPGDATGGALTIAALVVGICCIAALTVRALRAKGPTRVEGLAGSISLLCMAAMTAF